VQAAHADIRKRAAKGADMSGWIKLEKDLLTDPRVIRMAAVICKGLPLHGVTVVLGALAHLWMIADTHIGNDDVLPLGVEDINKVIGIDGFCQLVPPDWLQVINAHSVKLPNFHAHNGTIAKERAQNARRVAKHRSGNARKLPHGNGRALPDQDQDQDQDSKKETSLRDAKKNGSKGNASRIPDDFALTPEREACARAERLDPRRTLSEFVDHWRAASGPNSRKCDWDATWRNWCRRAQNFKPRTNGHLTPVRDDAAAWAELRARASAIRFDDPWPKESLEAYRTRVKMAEDLRPPQQVRERIAGAVAALTPPATGEGRWR
jgi:hypothetical protein